MTDKELETLGNLFDEKLKPVFAKLNGLETKVTGIETTVRGIKVQQEEDHLILKALEHNSNINSAEHDKMSNDISHIQGSLKNIDEQIGAMAEINGRHEQDITVLKRRPV